ncbi:MAG: hypothetical protein OCD76_25175 [Reichenbachiella sp.]
MIDWVIISFLILAGIALIVVEVIFVPGTTIVGVMGFLMAGYGIYRGYEIYGITTGHFILGVSSVIGFGAVFYSFKSQAWKKFALNGQIKSKVNEDLTKDLSIGQQGMTLSVLRPMGKAEFEDKEYEVSSLGNMVVEGLPVEIIKIDRNKIYVEPTNND